METSPTTKAVGTRTVPLLVGLEPPPETLVQVASFAPTEPSNLRNCPFSCWGYTDILDHFTSHKLPNTWLQLLRLCLAICPALPSTTPCAPCPRQCSTSPSCHKCPRRASCLLRRDATPNRNKRCCSWAQLTRGCRYCTGMSNSTAELLGPCPATSPWNFWSHIQSSLKPVRRRTAPSTAFLLFSRKRWPKRERQRDGSWPG